MGRVLKRKDDTIMEVIYEHPIWTLVFLVTIGFWLAVIAEQFGKRKG